MITPYFSDGQASLYLGNCLAVLPEIPDNSIDAVVTDGPYGLAELSTATVLQAIAAWMAGDRDHVPNGKGFMGQEWDRFVPPPGVWDQCLRVLKPGGHLLSFAAPRTQDLMGLSIRIAGFEMRDGISWIFGNGFPKGADISKAVDRAAGQNRETIGISPFASRKPNGSWTGAVYGTEAKGGGSLAMTAPATAEAQRWQGWNTALKPAHEPIVVARKSTGFNTTVANVLEHGTGAINIDACRIPVADAAYAHNAAGDRGHADNRTRRLEFRQGAGSAHSLGRWPTNVVFSHSPECAGACAPDCPVAALDDQTGILTSGFVAAGTPRGNRSGYSGPMPAITGVATHGDSGGGSRFFPVFRYEPKAPASERPRLDDGTTHTTVKPLDLMRWLVRLVTPPGGTVLDPFAGSGTTLEACIVEGFHAIGIEKEQPYAELCRTRLAKPIQPVLGFDEEAS